MIGDTLEPDISNIDVQKHQSRNHYPPKVRTDYDFVIRSVDFILTFDVVVETDPFLPLPVLSQVWQELILIV